ncbi:MAG: potassium channel family protein [Candidatus Micrarchaeota archaeon]|nr:potassium channel family protein [Candidatus Micrarchaeota archaeon]
MKNRQIVEQKIKKAFVILVIIYALAIVIYHTIEGWSWEESIYFTTATITTVGYGDIVPHTTIGKMMAIPLMWIGIAVGFYFIYTIQQYGVIRLEERTKAKKKWP